MCETGIANDATPTTNVKHPIEIICIQCACLGFSESWTDTYGILSSYSLALAQEQSHFQDHSMGSF